MQGVSRLRFVNGDLDFGTEVPGPLVLSNKLFESNGSSFISGVGLDGDDFRVAIGIGEFDATRTVRTIRAKSSLGLNVSIRCEV